MQTTFQPLSGPGLIAYAKKSAILFVSIFFVSSILSKKENPSLQTPKTSQGKDFTAIVNKMAEVKYKAHKDIAHSPALTDSNQLKQSDWYKTVKTDIEKRMYYVVADKQPKVFRSINAAQNFKTDYDETKFTFEPLQSVTKKRTTENNWELNIGINGLFADGKLITNSINTNNNAIGNTNDIEYNFSNAYTIQYHNDAKGVRQNFLIKEKPAPTVHEIKISMKAEGNWVVNKVHDNELHFAKKNGKGTLDSKIVYNDLKAWDANGKILHAKMEVTDNNNFEIVTNVENASYPITIDPLSSTPSSTLAGTAANNFFGGSVASAGDINGDGYSDVIIGSVGVSGGAGAAYIFLGSASGLSASPATTLTGVSALDSFGISVASAGDINGDGFSDVIVGAKGVSSHAGAAYIYLGSASGLTSTPSAILTGNSASDNFGTSVANAGDLNNDGFSDVIIGAYGVASNKGAAYVFLGSASGIASGSSASASATLNGASTGDRFGIAVASAGDIDGDGNSDLIVGAPLHSFGTGAAYIYLGTSLTSPSATLNGVSLFGGFGASVASTGDVNGDGYSDVIVGAPAVSSSTGAAYIFVGSNAGIVDGASASTTLSGASTNQFFGISVASAGDMNGDAFSDVVIGAIGTSTDPGTAYVFEGTSSGISDGATATLTINGTNASGDFGASVASSGDINGDGYSDLLVGEPNSSTATGNAYTYQGQTDVPATTNTLSIVAQSGGDRYGISVSSAGDINGDGYSDVIVGAIGYNGGFLDGAAYVYLGSANGLSTVTPTILTPGIEEVGWDVASAGDIDGDGYGDILIGAKFTSGPGGPPNYNYGAVYIYRGSSTGALTLSATLNGLNLGDVFGESISSAGDVNGDGYSDIIIGAPGVSTTNNVGGAAYLYMGSAAGIQSTDVPIVLNGLAADAAFGANVASAGDVNGDGYGDIIIGAPNLGSGYQIRDLGTDDNGSGIGSAYIFYGNKNGIANNATADVTLTDASVVDFGISVSSAGDVNGDGFSDVIVGASSGDNTSNPGSAEIFLGSAGGLSTSASTILNGLAAGDEFGATVATAGDVNGDGYGDVIIRATMPSSTNTSTGAAYIYLGGPTGLSSTIATTISDVGSNTYLETPTNAAGNIMHRAVASAGDVNGDGYSDVLVGVYVDNNKAGKTYLYYGNNAVGRNASNVLKLYETDFSAPISADNLTKSDFGLGLFAQSPFGTVKGRLVWEVEPNGTAFQGNPITNNIVTTGNQTAYSLLSAGGSEFRNVIPKSSAKATKVRVRMQYAPTAVTFGQVYSPWIYSQVYLLGGNLGILPLSVTLTANTSGQDILLNWKASEENDMSAYVVEHSLNGIKFDSLGTVASKGTTGTSSYDFTHYHPSVGVHYYRLREVNKDGTKTYSEIVSAKIKGMIEFSIYPNPASDHIVITHSGIMSNAARIMNSSGAVVGQYKLNTNGDQTTISLSGFAKGNYFVEIVNSGFAPKQITVQ